MANEKYMEYLAYVKEYLAQNGGIVSPNPRHPFRSRFQHTIRVLHWCSRLAEGVEGVDKEALYTAAIFHGAAGLSMNMPRTARWTWRSVRR